jgi:hypothetical protein
VVGAMQVPLQSSSFSSSSLFSIFGRSKFVSSERSKIEKENEDDDEDDWEQPIPLYTQPGAQDHGKLP